jgi:hypothetical protein
LESKFLRSPHVTNGIVDSGSSRNRGPVLLAPEFMQGDFAKPGALTGRAGP